MSEVKNFTPMDLALLRRLTARGLSLDVAMILKDAHPLETALLGAMGLPGRGQPTYILRDGESSFASQMQVEDSHARITMIAPEPDLTFPIAPWLALIENMVRQAGRRHAKIITAEVPVVSAGFEVFRRAGFTVYSRESIYYRGSEEESGDSDAEESGLLFLRPIEETDYVRLDALYSNTVPRMVQQVAPPPSDCWDGFAIMQNNRLRGCLYVQTGKRGALIQPFLHPELYDLVGEVFRQALPLLDNQPLFVRLRAHQEWLRNTLSDLGFVEYSRYALMARHTVIKTETHVFSPLTVLEHMALPGNIEIALDIREPQV
jgi:hypothetical protein